MLEGEVAYRRLTVVHAEPRWRDRIGALLGPWVPDAHRRGVAHVVRTGERQVAADVPDTSVLVACDDAERLVAELRCHRLSSMPLFARPRPLGALTLVATDGRRRFDDVDMALAETLARLAGLCLASDLLAREVADTSRRQDDLLAALSHQLRTPLTAMMAWLQLVRHGTDVTATTHALDAIERNGRLLGRLIDDLLDTARILIGKVDIAREPMNLVPVVERAVAAELPSAREKGIGLDTALDQTGAAYVGDRDRLEQVVGVLLANAVKFTPPGGHILTRLDGDANRVRILVSDNGRGIPGDLLPHVFEIFRRGVDDPSWGGLGLGLAIVRGLVELHGGTVEAASDGDGRGATFTVLLPRRV